MNFGSLAVSVFSALAALPESVTAKQVLNFESLKALLSKLPEAKALHEALSKLTAQEARLIQGALLSLMGISESEAKSLLGRSIYVESINVESYMEGPKKFVAVTLGATNEFESAQKVLADNGSGAGVVIASTLPESNRIVLEVLSPESLTLAQVSDAVLKLLRDNGINESKVRPAAKYGADHPCLVTVFRRTRDVRKLESMVKTFKEKLPNVEHVECLPRAKSAVFYLRRNIKPAEESSFIRNALDTEGFKENYDVLESLNAGIGSCYKLGLPESAVAGVVDRLESDPTVRAVCVRDGGVLVGFKEGYSRGAAHATCASLMEFAGMSGVTPTPLAEAELLEYLTGDGYYTFDRYYEFSTPAIARTFANVARGQTGARVVDIRGNIVGVMGGNVEMLSREAHKLLGIEATYLDWEGYVQIDIPEGVQSAVNRISEGNLNLPELVKAIELSESGEGDDLFEQAKFTRQFSPAISGVAPGAMTLARLISKRLSEAGKFAWAKPYTAAMRVDFPSAGEAQAAMAAVKKSGTTYTSLNELKFAPPSGLFAVITSSEGVNHAKKLLIEILRDVDVEISESKISVKEADDDGEPKGDVGVISPEAADGLTGAIPLTLKFPNAANAEEMNPTRAKEWADDMVAKGFASGASVSTNGSDVLVKFAAADRDTVIGVWLPFQSSQFEIVDDNSGAAEVQKTEGVDGKSSKTLPMDVAKAMVKKYDRQEDQNNHTGNYLMLAQAYGTSEEAARVAVIKKKRDSGGGVEYADSDWMYKNINPYYKLLLRDAGMGEAEQKTRLNKIQEAAPKILDVDKRVSMSLMFPSAGTAASHAEAKKKAEEFIIKADDALSYFYDVDKQPSPASAGWIVSFGMLFDESTARRLLGEFLRNWNLSEAKIQKVDAKKIREDGSIEHVEAFTNVFVEFPATSDGVAEAKLFATRAKAKPSIYSDVDGPTRSADKTEVVVTVSAPVQGAKEFVTAHLKNLGLTEAKVAVGAARKPVSMVQTNLTQVQKYLVSKFGPKVEGVLKSNPRELKALTKALRARYENKKLSESAALSGTALPLAKVWVEFDTEKDYQKFRSVAVSSGDVFDVFPMEKKRAPGPGERPLQTTVNVALDVPRAKDAVTNMLKKAGLLESQLKRIAKAPVERTSEVGKIFNTLESIRLGVERNSGTYTVTLSPEAVADWKSNWPGSRLPVRELSFDFDLRNGDLVDMNPSDMDGEDVLALSNDAAWLGAKKLGLSNVAAMRAKFADADSASMLESRLNLAEADVAAYLAGVNPNGSPALPVTTQLGMGNAQPVVGTPTTPAPQMFILPNGQAVPVEIIMQAVARVLNNLVVQLGGQPPAPVAPAPAPTVATAPVVAPAPVVAAPAPAEAAPAEPPKPEAPAADAAQTNDNAAAKDGEAAKTNDDKAAADKAKEDADKAKAAEDQKKADEEAAKKAEAEAAAKAAEEEKKRKEAEAAIAANKAATTPAPAAA